MKNLSLIVAFDEQGAMGRGNALLWHLPEDLKWFKQHTLGKAVIMGRKTHQSIGRPLPKRHNIVVTRDPFFQAPGCSLVRSWAEAIALAQQEPAGAQEIMVIGGAQIYALALPEVARLYVTRLQARFEADVFFPTLDWSQWQRVFEERHPRTTDCGLGFSFEIWELNNTYLPLIPRQPISVR